LANLISQFHSHRHDETCQNSPANSSQTRVSKSMKNCREGDYRFRRTLQNGDYSILEAHHCVDVYGFSRFIGGGHSFQVSYSCLQLLIKLMCTIIINCTTEIQHIRWRFRRIRIFSLRLSSYKSSFLSLVLYTYGIELVISLTEVMDI